MVSDGGTRPYRVHYRDPSFTNLQAVAAMCEGGMVADAISAVASIEPEVGGGDRGCARARRADDHEYLLGAGSATRRAGAPGRWTDRLSTRRGGAARRGRRADHRPLPAAPLGAAAAPAPGPGAGRLPHVSRNQLLRSMSRPHRRRGDR